MYASLIIVYMMDEASLEKYMLGISVLRWCSLRHSSYRSKNGFTPDSFWVDAGLDFDSFEMLSALLVGVWAVDEPVSSESLDE